MGRKRQKLRSDADDRASVYAGYQRRGKNYRRADRPGGYFQRSAHKTDEHTSVESDEAEQSDLIVVVRDEFIKRMGKVCFL